jgi:beta-xylosidase
MLPESRRASSIRLYRAQEFPGRWTFAAELLNGQYADPSIVFHDGRWWLFAYRRDDSLTLHHAEQPTGPWSEHPQSPIVRNSKTSARPGGRLVPFQGKILRYAQDGEFAYGGSLRVFQIDEVSTTNYREHAIAASPILAPSGRGWNATGMHHADVHQTGDKSWIACVDGNRSRKAFNWRMGASRLIGFLRRKSA